MRRAALRVMVPTALCAGTSVPRVSAYRRLALAMIGAVALVVGFAAGAGAAGGVLDPAFGSGGSLITPFPETQEGGIANAITTSPLGHKVVVAGQVANGGSTECGGFLVITACGNANYDWGVVRYNRDGSLDPSFGDGGRVITAQLCAKPDDGPLNLCGGTVRAVSIAPDGSVVLGGDINEAGGAAVARIDADGQSGTLFATPSSTGPGEINALALDTTGRVVGAGWTWDTGGNGGYDLLVARWLATGSFDSSFGQNGVVKLSLSPVPSTNNENLFGVAVLPGNKILAAGYSLSSAGTDDLVLLQFNSDGTPDSSFGTNGVVRSRVEQPDGTDVRANALAVQTDGKIVIAGEGSGAMIARFNPNGTLDSGFANGGVYTTTVIGVPFQGVSIDPGGGVDAASQVNGNELAVLRLGSTGALDTTFGTDGTGLAAVQVGGGSPNGLPVAETGDCAGDIDLAGSVFDGPLDQFAAARFTAPVASACAQTEEPVMSTQSSAAGSAVPAGTAVSDQATLAGADGPPTGTVTFFLCQPATVAANEGDCRTGGDQVGVAVTLSSDGKATSTGSTNTTAAGTYCWRAEYAGDDPYTNATDTGNANECFAVPITNHPPVANAQTVTTVEATPQALTLTASDADGDPLTYAVATQPTHGTLSGIAPNLTYTPSLGFSGADSFTFTASDGKAVSAPATVSIDVAAAAGKGGRGCGKGILGHGVYNAEYEADALLQKIYDFQTGYVYCYTKSNVKFLTIDTLANVGNNFIVDALEALGFTPSYKNVQTFPDSGDASAQFLITFNANTLFTYIGLEAVGEKFFVEKLGPELETELKAEGYGVKFKKQLAEGVEEILTKMQETADEGLNKLLGKLPDSVAGPLHDFLLQQFTDFLDTIRSDVHAALSKDSFKRLTGVTIGKRIFQFLVNEEAKVAEWDFQAWDPTIHVTASVDSQQHLHFSQKWTGFKNPFLHVSKD